MSWITNGQNHKQGIQGEKDLKNFKNNLEKIYNKSILYIISKYDVELCKKYNLNLGGTGNLIDNVIVFADETIQNISLKTLANTIGWVKGGMNDFGDFIKNIKMIHETYKYTFENNILSNERKKELDTKIKNASSTDISSFPSSEITRLLKKKVEQHDMLNIDIIIIDPKTKEIIVGEPNWFSKIRNGKIATITMNIPNGKESSTVKIDGELVGISFRLKTNNGTTIWLTKKNNKGEKKSSSVCLMIQQSAKKAKQQWKTKQKN